MMGFGNLVFAGGRDTIIHSVSSIIHYLGRNPEALEYLRADPKRLVHAGEEFFRVFMPLTQIGRVCPAETEVHGAKVPANGRVSLGWAAANFDPAVFASPEEIRLDRRPNSHLSFGFGAHLCLGAPPASYRGFVSAFGPSPSSRPNRTVSANRGTNGPTGLSLCGCDWWGFEQRSGLF